MSGPAEREARDPRWLTTEGPATLPERCDVVVIGGGIVGASVAYHLADERRRVVVLEQGLVGGGTTWHAAGLVGRLRTSSGMTRINEYSADLYAALEERTGVPLEWRRCGSLNVARTPERRVQLLRSAALVEHFGVEAREISIDEAQERWPPMRTDDLAAAFWIPGDGRLRPDRVAIALARAAVDRGARIFEGVRVEDLVVEGGRVRGARVEGGEIGAETVVLSGGMWSRALALRVGVDVPLWPVRHHYVLSEPIEGVHEDLPVMRDYDGHIYLRPEGSAIVLGAFQRRSEPWRVDEVPPDFSFGLFEDDWPAFAAPLAAGRRRIPALETARFPRFVNGPESFTPDNNFLLGPAPGLDGLWVAAGFNSAGIACAGGAGHAVAEWILRGAPPFDLWSADVRRFAPWQNDPVFLQARVAECLGLHYRMAWPNREFEEGRGLRRSPLHERLEARGAVFGSKLGIERPSWFAPEGVERRTDYSFEKPRWLEHSAREHRAARQAAALFDQSSFARFEVSGADATACLQSLCGNDIDAPAGSVVYTAILDERGRFDSDVTVLRLDDESYWVISPTGQRVHDLDVLRRAFAPSAQVRVDDVSDGWGVLGLMGPRSREILATLTDASLETRSFPFGAWREIDLAGREVRAARITYVGELGYELHARVEDLPTVFEALEEAGRPLGMVLAGHAAIQSLRLEKGYRAWGSDLSTDDTPLEAGLGFALAWEKSPACRGLAALARQRRHGLQRRLISLVLADPDTMLWGGETVQRDGVTVGHTSSAAYGHTLGAAVALAWVRAERLATREWIEAAEWTVTVAGVARPARACLRAPYDPKRRRILV